jgi:membrane-bound serine protease (ClpP class)
MNWHRLAAITLLCGVVSFALCAGLHANADSAAPVVVKLVFNDTVQPVSEAILTRAVEYAAGEHAGALLIEINTPGGLLETTRTMVQRIEQSATPVIIYVAPTGSRAASAGFFLLESADVAAMAPGTNTGAAHPVEMGRTLDPIMKQKLENDATAFLRSYVGRRGRNLEAAQAAVLESKAYSDKEALDLHLIDLIAKDDADLLRQLDGRTIQRFDGSNVTLRFGGARIEDLAPTLRERLLDTLMNPDLALMLLVIGGLLIYLEFHVPGTVVPGAVGTLLVLVSLFALNLLPLRYTSLALLLCGLLLVVAEAKFPSHGLLSLTGTIAVVFGMLTLVNGPIPEMRIHLATTLALALAFGGITFFIAVAAFRARKTKATTGPQAMLGEIAIVQTPLKPEGQVFVHGEIWNAVSHEHAAKGEEVVVHGVDGLTLKVRRVSAGRS